MIRERLDAEAQALRRIVDLMKARDIDATGYQQLLIEATGNSPRTFSTPT